MSTLDRRIAALPADSQAAVFLYLEFVEGRNQQPRSVGAYCVRSAPSKENPAREIGPRLRAVREALNQSEESAATVAGVTLATYRMYEAGQIGRWATRKVISYATAWNVSFDWLIEGAGSMFRDDKPPRLAPSEMTTPRKAIGKPPKNFAELAASAASNVVSFKRSKGGAA